MPLNSLISQATQAFVDRSGRALPLLRTKFGVAKSIGVTTSPGAATQVHTNDYDTPVRIWAIGCPIIYIFGGSGVAAPSTTVDGYIGQDRFVETFMSADENYIRLAAASGSGTVKIEILR